MKPLVIYHKYCLDGFGAAYAAWKSLGDDAEYVAMDYSERDSIWDHELMGRDIYILDFSFGRLTTETIIQKCGNFVWLDHHRSAFEDWPKGRETEFLLETVANEVHILLDNSKSGAILAWEYFHPYSHPSIPALIAHIDDRDRWQWKIPGTKEVCTYLATLEQNFTVWENVVEGYEESPVTLINYGKLLDGYYQTQLSRSINATKRECCITGVKGLCCNLPPMFASEAGNLLALQSGTYGATWFLSDSGNVKWSLRSIGNFDVAARANKYGGGGHLNAAGFTISLSEHYKLINEGIEV